LLYEKFNDQTIRNSENALNLLIEWQVEHHASFGNYYEIFLVLDLIGTVMSDLSMVMNAEIC
jgi:hypothetical protein